MGFERDIGEEFPIKFARILLDLVFAWGISLVICLAGNLAANLACNTSRFYSGDFPDLVVDCNAILQYGAGAFCLGTLARKTNIWLLAFLFILPLLFLVPYSGPSLSELARPLGSVALGFIGSLCAIAAGQSTQFNRDKAALDIPWYHWLWLFPTSLFQAVCVPLTLFFAFFEMELICSRADLRPVGRIAILILLPIFLLLIYNARRILASPAKLTGLQRFTLIFSWLFLTIPQAILLVIQSAKDIF
ncbi:MAG: hypothetical protein P4L53_02460 [Candidatus Obscuribacterales bacterium]|nr:hypothetical protein [Candidatus Obscuribacterales bacterium]